MSAHVKEGIARYFRGDITDAGERDQLFVHLRACDECRAAFDAESAMHRALTGQAFSQVELDAMMPSLVESAARGERPALVRWATWASGLVAAAAMALVVIIPRLDDGLTPKGGHDTVSPVHVLCFDGARAITGRRTASGSCPTPGFVKVMYARSETVPVLTVVVMAGDEVRAHGVVRTPASGTLVPDHAELRAGDELRVIAIGGDAEISLDIAKSTAPVLTVRGEP